MMKKELLLSLILMLGISQIKAQNIRTVEKFSELATEIQQPGDTLMVYNFWATWCRPCVKELPYFEQLSAAYADKKIKFVFISLDFAAPSVENFVKTRGFKGEVIHLTDPKQNDWIPRISEEWGGAIPATLVVMPKHDIHEFKAQSFTYEELKAWIDTLYKQAQG